MKFREWIWVLAMFPIMISCIFVAYEAYSYFHPNVIISYKVMKAEDVYLSLPSYAIETKSHFGYAPKYDEEMREWWIETNAVEVWLHTDFVKPINVSSNVVSKDGKTIITYSGTAGLPSGEIVTIDREIELGFAVR